MHIDMDAFFAAIEENNHPELRGRPIAVAGHPDSRSVVSSANYIAREYGVRSAMPVREALQKCPDLQCVPGLHSRYSKISERIMDIFYDFTPDLEILSIDEANLNVKGTKHLFGHQIRIAKEIKKKIKEEFNLTCSIGIAENVLVAKMAANLEKPDGLTVMSNARFIKISDEWSVRKVPGIGKKAEEELALAGIRTLGGIRRTRKDVLRNWFGHYGYFLHNAAWGICAMEMNREPARRSIGHEVTLEKDTADQIKLRSILLSLNQKVCRRLREQEEICKTVCLKIRYSDFSTFTMRNTMKEYTDIDEEIYRQALELFKKIKKRPVRLIGLTLSGLQNNKDFVRQVDLFDGNKIEKERNLNLVADKLKDRFGEHIITRAGSINRLKNN